MGGYTRFLVEESCNKDPAGLRSDVGVLRVLEIPV